MNLKPKKMSFDLEQPAFLRDAKNLEWTVGQITLDSSKLDEGQLVPAGTAVHKNEETELFELVAQETAEELVAPVLTGHSVVVSDTVVNEQVSALRKASVYEEQLTGVTDEFKKATQGRIVYDV